jgi:hypothetical protein
LQRVRGVGRPQFEIKFALHAQVLAGAPGSATPIRS